ncbi:DgyrCDS5010 [Dimorphilus gyrociliatus]|uniref:DgyrCDS5010 n=1 Tax=Dimorphilus gyrociliatus TaxID=2664684 RepID=A0A7I8VIE2_9ANNE|nr:DgyrCDS5010 [Dimorphilus gyrociliatus]
MVERHSDYTYSEKLRISVGTWNVNGGKHFRSIAHKHESITDWLLDLPKLTRESRPELLRNNINYDRPVDIYAIGFQEIIDLNASNIMNASTTNQREWGKYLQDIISRDHKYVLLTSIQLVGVCLYIFIRPKHAPFIRDVGVDSVKTGLGGAAGNKGGVAIRFVMHHNSFVFVCSHLSAGQSHMQARNQEFHEIAQKLHFPMGRTISSHDYIIWCGDLNYRIDMPNSEVREAIKHGEYETLMAEDQLLKQRNLGSVFKGFLEFPTNFAPTYKYDLFCNDYDTSEKNRIPAWTDRILIRKKPWPKYIGEESAEPNEGITQMLYNRAELKTSDHRPVLALYDVELIRVNSERRFDVYDEVISLQGPSDATVVVFYSDNAGMDDESFQNIIQVIGASGNIILVRFVEQSTLITFSSGKEALEAVKSDGLSIGGREMRVTLKTGDWKQILQREMKLADICDEPVADEAEEVEDDVPELSSSTDRRSKFIKRLSLLREDSNFPTMSFDVDDEDEEAVTGKSKSREPSPRPEDNENRQSSVKKPDKPKPPERPAAPPARPPPPAPNRPAPPVNRPTSVLMRNHPTGSKQTMQASRISQPVDVVHRHASNPAEMKELINSLMSPTSPTSANLPAPMQPQKPSPPATDKSTPTTPPKPAPRSASSNSLSEKATPAVPPRRDVPPVAAPRNSMSPEDSSNKTVPPVPARPNAPPAVPPRNFQS